MSDRDDAHRNKMPPFRGKEGNRMAGVITWNRLRELAAFRAQNGLAISLYIGFDPSDGRDDARHGGDEDELAARRGAEVDVRQPGRADARPEARGCSPTSSASATSSRTTSTAPARRASPIFAAGLDPFWSVERAERARAGPRVRRARLLPPAARAAARPRRGSDRRRHRPRARPALPARRTDGSSRSRI